MYYKGDNCYVIWRLMFQLKVYWLLALAVPLTTNFKLVLWQTDLQAVQNIRK